jgi:hypothetical protein
MTGRFVLVQGGMRVAGHFDTPPAAFHAGVCEVEAPDPSGLGSRSGEKARWDDCREAVTEVVEKGHVFVCHPALAHMAALAAMVTASVIDRISDGRLPDAAYYDCDGQLAREAHTGLLPEQTGLVLDPLLRPKFDDMQVPRGCVVPLVDSSGGGIRAKAEALKRQPKYFSWTSHSVFLSRPRDTGDLLLAIGGRA